MDSKKSQKQAFLENMQLKWLTFFLILFLKREEFNKMSLTFFLSKSPPPKTKTHKKIG